MAEIINIGDDCARHPGKEIVSVYIPHDVNESPDGYCVQCLDEQEAVDVAEYNGPEWTEEDERAAQHSYNESLAARMSGLPIAHAEAARWRERRQERIDGVAEGDSVYDHVDLVYG